MDKRVLKCAHCERSFKNRGALMCHLRSHKPQMYGCAQCGRIFFRFGSLRHHLNTVHTGNRNIRKDSQKPFQCDICGNSFGTIQHLSTHAHIHKPRQHKCSKCDAKFIMRSTLERHLLLIHQIKASEEFHCKLCGKICPNWRSFAHHSKNYHSASQLSCNQRVSRFICDICCRPFDQSYQIRKHLSGHYPAVNRETIEKSCRKRQFHSCENQHCSKTNLLQIASNTTVPVNQHTLPMNVKMEFICANCGKRFTHKHLLLSHLSVHQLPKFSCQVCSTKFRRLGNLRVHLRDKHPLNTEQLLAPTCAVCGKQFPNAKALRWHKLCSHGESCKICGIKFSTLYNLSIHVQSVHRNNCERPTLKCSICMRPFIRQYFLWKHLNGHN